MKYDESAQGNNTKSSFDAFQMIIFERKKSQGIFMYLYVLWGYLLYERSNYNFVMVQVKQICRHEKENGNTTGYLSKAQ